MSPGPTDDVADQALRTLLERRALVAALRDGQKDKRTLVDHLEVSRSTVSRALKDLQSHHLVERSNGTFETTAYGDLLFEEFDTLLETASSAWRIRDVLDQVPTEALGFELSHLTDADVTTPTTTNPSAPIERVVELKRQATHVRSLAAGRSPGALDAHERAAEASDHTFESVVTDELVEWLVTEAGRQDTLTGLLEADGVAVFVYDGDIPVPLGITEDVVFFGLESAEGAPVALVESTNSRVREWAADTFESCRAAATKLAPADLENYADA
jgi:predicted transcriptional regulator